MAIKLLNAENRNVYITGCIYMRIGDNFTDSTNVYDGKNTSELVKLGVINFVTKGKPILNKYTGVMKYVDGFVFNPEPNTVIECATFKHIARYVYDLNEQFKEYARLKQGGESNNE